jgi:hypothetical protein
MQVGNQAVQIEHGRAVATLKKLDFLIAEGQGF